MKTIECEVYCYLNGEAVDYGKFTGENAYEKAIMWANEMIKPDIEYHNDGKMTHHATYIINML